MSEFTGIFNREGSPICAAYGADEAWKCAEMLCGMSKAEMLKAGVHAVAADLTQRESMK